MKWAGFLLLCTFLLQLPFLSAADEAKRRAAGAYRNATQPNIIFLLVDDTDLLMGSLDHLPNLAHHFTRQGATFTNYFVNFAVCCPSRVSTLLGRCSHNTGVIWNLHEGFLGGESRFIELGHEESAINVLLQRAGYRTGLFGKYLNGYGFTPGTGPPGSHVPPGWDDWFAFVNIGYENWTASDNGRLVHFGDSDDDYSTDVVTEKAVEFIRRQADDPRPFFLYLAPYAAHTPSVPARRHRDILAGLKVPRTPNYNGNYRSIHEKASALRYYPKLPKDYLKLYDYLYQMRVETLLAVDDQISAVMGALDDIQAADTTYATFASDNGYHFSHHRMAAGKTSPYEEDIHLPLVVRGPGVPAGVRLPHMIGNIDHFHTWLDLAGVELPEELSVDGMSYASILQSDNARDLPEENFRQAFLIEKVFADGDPHNVGPQIVINSPPSDDPFQGHRPPNTWPPPFYPPAQPEKPRAALPPADYTPRVNKGQELTADGLALAEGRYGNNDGAGHQWKAYLEDRGYDASIYPTAVGFGFPGTYYGIRVINALGNLLYVELPLGHELYDLEQDPYQRNNLFSSSPVELVVELQAALDHLKYQKGPYQTVRNLSIRAFDEVAGLAGRRPRRRRPLLETK